MTALSVLLILVVMTVLMAVKVVPQQKAYVLERLGKFYAVLQPGVNFIIPFFDRIAYKYSLKEAAIDIPEQICITRDNVQVRMDGVIFIQVIDPKKAAYGIADYTFAVIQLAQTTMRSEIGKLDLDKTFEERMTINRAVVESIDEAAIGWGVKVLRYEIKNITPPQSVLIAMEKQMQAERERRAVILQSDGEKQAAINVAEKLYLSLKDYDSGRSMKRRGRLLPYVPLPRPLRRVSGWLRSPFKLMVGLKPCS
jgi:regulator of protease activity HflC (stomatin/prohibitin superfamily)